MARINLKTAPRYKYSQLVKAIADENAISEAVVKTTLRGLVNVIIRELANDKVVDFYKLGLFFASKKTTVCHWLPQDHPDRERVNIGPRFHPHIIFRQKLQALTGHKISTLHQDKETYTAIRENPDELLQLNQLKQPRTTTSAFHTSQ